ncbi:MAG TPA: hypothetical protein VGL84_04600 [Gaiellaceae bacterium]|jgi:hypothetical protein
MTVHSVRNHSLYAAPLRIALGLVWAFAARFAGASSPAVWLAFATATFALVFLRFNDPRSRFLKRGAPEPLPDGATVATPVRQALQALLPSTAGVSVLAAIALAFQPVLSAFLGGVAAGLGVSGAVMAYFTDPALFFDPRRGTVYRR